ncbi:MAG: flippase-like domain-containing protein [Clostridia bacterium]|nr:flippase-like domain-containing protein [Clostridia bacterium]
MKVNKKYVFSIIFFIVMLILTIFILFKDNDIEQIISIAKTVDIKYLGICLLLVIFYLLFEAFYILITFKSLKQKTTLSKCFAYSCVEYYFSAITPSSTGGQPFQSYYMAKDNIPVSKSTIVLLLNTLTFKLILLLLGIVCLVIKPSTILTNGLLFNILFIIGFIINLTVIILCLLVMKSKRKVKKFVVFLINLLAKLHLKKNPEETIKKIDEYMDDFKKGVNYIKTHPIVTLKVLGLTLLQRVSMFSIGFVVYLAFGLTGYSFIEFLTIQVAIAIAIDSLPFPGGMGITEVIMLNIYTGIYGESLLTAAVILTRLFSYYFCLIFSGGISLINHLKTMIKNNSKEEIYNDRIL